MIIIASYLLINFSTSTLIELDLDHSWRTVPDSEEYKDGWTTFKLKSSCMAEIKILDGGEFHFAWKMDRLRDTKLHLDNELLENTLEFIEYDRVKYVSDNDKMKWVFSVMGKDNTGQVWISFPSEYLNGSISKTQYKTQNISPELSSLIPDKTSPQNAGSIIKWTAKASDKEHDILLYRFLINGSDKTGWINESEWLWNTTSYLGTCEIEVHIRDGKHYGSDGFDANKSSYFRIKPRMEAPKPVIYSLEIQSDKASPQMEGSSIEFKALINGLNLNNILYRFILRDHAATEWSRSPFWTWNTNNTDLGTSQIGVQIKNGNNTNEGGFDYFANVSYDIGILASDDRDLLEVVSSALEHNIKTVFINGSHSLDKTLIINNSSLNLIGISKTARLTPASNNLECAFDIRGDNFRIMNISINGFPESIRLHANNCTIENTTISSSETAINVDNSDNITLMNNVFHGHHDKGTGEGGVLLYINNSSYGRLINNTFNNSFNPINLESVRNSLLEKNNITYHKYGIDMIGCTNVFILNNLIIHDQTHENARKSIRICRSCDYIHVASNTIEGNACDENINNTNKWEMNCWKDASCSGSAYIPIQRCHVSGRGSLDQDPICCNGG